MHLPPSTPFRRFLPANREQALGLLLTLLVQVLLALLLLSIAPASVRHKLADMVLFSIHDVPAPSASQPEPPEARAAEQPTPPAKPQPVPPPTPQPPVPPPVVETPAPPVPDIAKLPPSPPVPAPARPAYGPPDPRPKAALMDTPRVEGAGPNGEPLYAASWFREPWPDELRGYLSTARGPGWGLIACRTVANYRVEDCVILDESPRGSGIARAAQAAAWQFLVRPPQKGGRAMVGEWVRIRIEYEQQRAPQTG